jgi:predicted secreted hydrolase
MRRRALLIGALPAGLSRSIYAEAVRSRPLAFPADFGAHPNNRIEWWYATGALRADVGDSSAAEETYGFQVTFFRSRTDVAEAHTSRFAAKQLVFAHAAVTDVAQRRLHHDQRVARAGFGITDAREGDTQVRLRDWHLVREGAVDRSIYRTRVHSDSAAFSFDFTLSASQAPLLQGNAGYSRKGPDPAYASHYYSQPQLQVRGTLALAGRTQAVRGVAWLDHEWSDAPLAGDAVGWDWIGMNLYDGSALTAFRLRRRDGSSLWAGGSYRAPGQVAQTFAADKVSFSAGRTWRSSASQAVYPVHWTVTTPAGNYQVRTRLDAQELDSRASSGSFYWEGLSDLYDASGQRVGRGYLEMTGYAAPLKL